MNAVGPQECTGEVTMRRVSGDEGIEGVSDSDVHGWTVRRYGADAKESGGAGVANLATVLHEAGEGKTEYSRGLGKRRRNKNAPPRIRTPSRRSGARSCHAPGGEAARGPTVGVLRSVCVAHRRGAESRCWGVFIIAVHRAFVLGLGARHRGIVELSEGVIRCVTVFAC